MAAPPSTAVRVSVAISFMAIVAGIIGGLIQPDASGNKRRSQVHWQLDGGDTPPAGEIRCVRAEVLAQPAALNKLGLKANAGEQYLLTRTCGAYDAGATDDDMPRIPPQWDVVDGTEREVIFDGGPQLWAFMPPEAELPCACSPGVNCQQLKPDNVAWVTAPMKQTLEEGRFRGNGCVNKPCSDMAGHVHSWPAACGPEH